MSNTVETLRDASKYLRESNWGHGIDHTECLKCQYANRVDDAADRIAALEAEIKSDNKTIELFKAENAALRKDAGRYRWLRQYGQRELFIACNTAGQISQFCVDAADAAIDAALAQPPDGVVDTAMPITRYSLKLMPASESGPARPIMEADANGRWCNYNEHVAAIDAAVEAAMKDAPFCAGGYSADDPHEFHCADCEAISPDGCLLRGGRGTPPLTPP